MIDPTVLWRAHQLAAADLAHIEERLACRRLAHSLTLTAGPAVGAMRQLAVTQAVVADTFRDFAATWQAGELWERA